ncbi:MAG: mechanosensitive ion channel family protein [Lachnospiraceae bacterium]|nr:mechanosensitive ion channel family protein [Lachnospiraceae bacterium]
MEKQAAELVQITPDEIDMGLIQTYLEQLPDKALRFGMRVVLALVFLLIGMQVIKLVRRIVRRSLKKANADVGVAQFLDSFIKVTMYIVLIFMIASGFGLDAASVVALLGSAGVAIGLAVQGSLSNFAGGVLILLLKPFRVDDYIKVDSDGHEGTVKEIQLFYTKLATPDNHVVIIPNGTLTNSSILNTSMLGDRRMDIPVGISYDADIRRAREVILQVLEDDAAVLKEKDRRVFVQELADSGVNLNVRCFALNEDYWECRWRITEQIKYALDEAGISIPYPQMDVHIDGNAGES